MSRVLTVVGAVLASLFSPTLARAQGQGCGAEFVECATAPIRVAHRVGLPIQVDLDTGWVPSGLPVQARFQAAIVGNTEVRMAGQLVAGWPMPLMLQAVGDRDGGNLSVDYGVQVNARVRLNLDTGVGRATWEGAIPYVPMIDFRARGSTTFTPWAWSPAISARGVTPRQRVAEIPLTDALVRIPGISGGFTIEIAAEIEANWRTQRITFGLDAMPITEAMPRTAAVFSAGPFAQYFPRVEGEFAHTGRLHVYPSLYVSLLGRRWTLQVADIPIPLGPFRTSVTTEPAMARLELPDITATVNEVDFGEVRVGETAERVIPVANAGGGGGRIVGVEAPSPFAAPTRTGLLPPRSRAMLVVTFSPVRAGAVDGEVVVTTSDPDTPRLRVRARGQGLAPPEVVDAGLAPPDADAAVADANSDASIVEVDGSVDPTVIERDGCGCRAGGSNTSRGVFPGWVVLAGVLARRRSRRSGSARPVSRGLPPGNDLAQVGSLRSLSTPLEASRQR